MTCPADREVVLAIRKLASGKSSEIASGRATLINASRQSSACRNEIIAALIKAMDRPNLDFNRDTNDYYLWRFGADLLGDLRATEALDLLISHLTQRSAFFSSSMNHQPALRGVIKMGSLAVPKLTEVLRHNSDPRMRYSAIYCIATIGGLSAIAALRETLVSESDPCAKRLIQASLDSFDDQGQIKNRLQWFATFTCDG
jgi:HEAT repeat protein